MILPLQERVPVGIRWRMEGKGVVKVKSSQKIFTDTETASLTGICVEHLHSLARSRHLGFIAPDGSGDAASALPALG
jgi:hypothetical protein